MTTLALASGAQAATYYVDPASGNDANPGNSPSAPWKTIPGTRTVGDTGWLNAAWGAISPSNPLQPGDVVELKAGSTMDASKGGRLLIDGNFYASGSPSAPIVIQVSSGWGSGPFVFSAPGMTSPRWGAIIDVKGRDYVQLKGASLEHRFILAYPGGDWGIQFYGSPSVHARGNAIVNVEIGGAQGGGFNVAYADDWQVANSVSHDNGSIGFSVGSINDEKTNNGLFIDTVAYGNGLNGSGQDIRHGFGLYGGTNIRYVRCHAFSNGRDGFDFGTTSNAGDSTATVVDSAAYNNGEDGFAGNGGTGMNWFAYYNSIAYGNGQAGWHIYNGPIAWLYHVVADDNGSQSGFGGNVLVYSEGSDKRVQMSIMNSIFYKPRMHAQFGSYGRSTDLPIIVSDNNHYIPRAGDDETFAEYPYGTAHTYKAPPYWVGPNDRIGIAHDPQFTATGTGNFATNDYRLRVTSPAKARAFPMPGLPDTYRTRDGLTRGNAPDIGAF